MFQPFISCFSRPTYSAPHWTSPTQALRCVIGHIQGVLTEVLELGTLSTDQVSFKICRSESLLYACGAVTVIPSTDFQCNHSTVKHACVLNSSRKLKLPWPRAPQQETLVCPSLSYDVTSTPVVHVLCKIQPFARYRWRDDKKAK